MNKIASNGSLQTTPEMLRAIAFVSSPERPGKKSSTPRRNHTLPITLSNRQTEVIRMIADGCSTRDIAKFLLISPKTVEKHRQALMKKLDLHNIAMLTRYAVSNGIVTRNLAAPMQVGNGLAAISHEERE